MTVMGTICLPLENRVYQKDESRLYSESNLGRQSVGGCRRYNDERDAIRRRALMLRWSGLIKEKRELLLVRRYVGTENLKSLRHPSRPVV